MKNFIIRKLGGYPTIDEAIDAVREHKDKRRILTLAVKHLYNTIGEDDIIKENKYGQMTVAGKELPKGERDHLKAEAFQFAKSTLWKVLQADIKHQANRKMFILSQSDDDITAGKLWLYTLDAIETRLKKLLKP